ARGSDGSRLQALWKVANTRFATFFVFFQRGHSMKKVQAPASKSVSHRMMMGAALASGESVVSRVLESRDLERTMAILRGAGARIERIAAGEYAVTGVS